MRLGYDLTLEQAQKLVMTPELRQAIQLLQFTSQELNEYLEKEIEVNPLLEAKNDAKEDEKTDEVESEDEEIDWEEFLGNYDDMNYTITAPRDKNEKEITYDNFVSYSSSLKEHLLLQLNLNISNEVDRLIGELIVESIDQNGYLLTDVEEIAEVLNCFSERVEKVLLEVQKFDPTGVGARDLKECLAIQLRDRKIKNENIYKVIESYLEDVAHNRLSKISKELDIELKEVQDICDYIKTLEPKPGRCFSGDVEEVKYINPDITLRYLDGEYIIILNDITAPRLNINRFYRQLMSNSDDPNITEFVTEKLNSAMWVIKSIEQRRMTIYNVVKSILKFQRDFF